MIKKKKNELPHDKIWLNHNVPIVVRHPVYIIQLDLTRTQWFQAQNECIVQFVSVVKCSTTSIPFGPDHQLVFPPHALAPTAVYHSLVISDFKVWKRRLIVRSKNTSPVCLRRVGLGACVVLHWCFNLERWGHPRGWR